MTFEDLKLYTKNPGTYRITAIFDGDDTYNAGTTQFILVVSANPDEPPTIIPLPEGSSEKITPILNFLEPTITQEEDIKTNKYTLQTPNNPSNVALSWSCDDDNVQFDLMNNQVIIPNIGEYVITATFLGDDDYNPVSASYTFRLTDDEGNVVRTQRHYHLYFEEDKYTFYENDDMIFPLQVPKTQRTDDNVVPQEILDLCYYTVNDDDIHLSGENPVAFSELGSYTIYLHFEGNEDWLPQTISYVFNIIEKENPEISFPQQRVFMHRNDEGKYALQTLYNPHSLSPIRWAVSDTQTDMIRLQPSNNVCYINRYGSFPIFAIFDGNEIYKKQEAAYEIVLIGSQEDANIHFERPSDRYDIEFNIGGGWTTNMPKLINPYNLPVTFSTSTNDIYVSEDGRNITFYRSVRDAVVTATFDGDEMWEPMSDTYTVTMIAWANRITPTLYFQKEEQEVAADEYGRYTLQRVSSPDVPKSELRWRVDGHTDGWRIESLTDDDHILYVDYWDYYTIVVEFDGDENWAPAQATYTLKPQREELRLWFDVQLETHYGFQEGYISTRPVQTCHSTIGDDIPLHWSTDVPRGCQIDTDSMRVLMYNEGMFTIRADFYGDTRYDPTHATYTIRCTSEEDPTITKEDVTISFENQFVYLQLHDDGTNIYYELQTPTITPNTIDPSWLSWSCDNGAIAYPYLVAPNGIGTYKITAQYLGSKNYNPSNVETYTVVISDEQVEAQDIEMRFYTPTDRFYVREDNTYDLQYVYWRIAGSNNEWQRCNFELTWTCSDNTATFDFSDADYPYITIPSGEGIYTITATFAGNGLYNQASASYKINVGNVVVERVSPELGFSYSTFNVNENYPDNLYALQAIIKPNDIQDSDLVWSISPGAPNEIRGNQIYVWDISEDVTITVTFAGNDKYLPDAASYKMHVVPETIVKKDTIISDFIQQQTLTWNQYGEVEFDPQNAIVYEIIDANTRQSIENALVKWSINNGGQIRGNYIEEDGQVVGVRNPKIYLDNIGTYIVSAQFMGDRYHNPSQVAQYTIILDYEYSSVTFDKNEVILLYEENELHYYYPIQAANNPNNMLLTYKLFVDGVEVGTINQPRGCDLITAAGEYQVRAYWTEYGQTLYSQYTLRIVDDMSGEDEGTVAFAEDTIYQQYTATNSYPLQQPICSGTYVLYDTTISSLEYGSTTYRAYPYYVQLEDGTSYTITLRYKVGGDNNFHTISYTHVIHPEYYGLTFAPYIDFVGLHFNPSQQISSRYYITCSIDAENVCQYGNGETEQEYDYWYASKSFRTITLDNSNIDLSFPFGQRSQIIDYYTGNVISESTWPTWYRFTKANIRLVIHKTSSHTSISSFNYVVERAKLVANTYWDGVNWKPTSWAPTNQSNPELSLPMLEINKNSSNTSSSMAIHLNNGANQNISTPFSITPWDAVLLSDNYYLFNVNSNTQAEVKVTKPTNDNYLKVLNIGHSNNVTLVTEGDFYREPEYAGFRITKNGSTGTSTGFTIYSHTQYQYYTSIPDSNTTPIQMIANPTYGVSGNQHRNYEYMIPQNNFSTYIYFYQPSNVNLYYYIDGSGNHTVQTVGGDTYKNQLHLTST